MNEYLSTLGLSDGRIIVWPFDKAPEILRALSNEGGDEDWVAVYAGPRRWIPWLDGHAFGFCDRQYVRQRARAALEKP